MFARSTMLPEVGFDPPSAVVPNLLNEKRTPIHSKPPSLDVTIEYFVLVIPEIIQ